MELARIAAAGSPAANDADFAPRVESYHLRFAVEFTVTCTKSESLADSLALERSLLAAARDALAEFALGAGPVAFAKDHSEVKSVATGITYWPTDQTENGEATGGAPDPDNSPWCG